MPIEIIANFPSGQRKLIIPYKSDQTIEYYLEQSLVRAGVHKQFKTQECKLYLKGLELFSGDTLKDLEISENESLNLEIFTTEPVPRESSCNEKKKEEEENQQTNNSSSLPIFTKNETEKIGVKQVDMVVMDVSGSMTCSAFHNGDNMTRIEAAQVFFQCYLDKFIQYEISAAVGLVCFGERIEQTFEITRNFDSFSTELGKLDANQGCTRLFEAIEFAAEKLDEYRTSNSSSLINDDIVFRVFCLTDGQDNSGVNPFRTYQKLKEKNIFIDSIGIGASRDHVSLSNLTKATGGNCFTVDSAQIGVELFEREAVVSPSVRDNFKIFSMNIENEHQMNSIGGEVFSSNEVKVATSSSISSKAVQFDPSSSSFAALLTKNSTTSSSSSSSSSLSGTEAGVGVGAGTGRNKRVLKEYTDFCQSEMFKKGELNVWINENDLGFWKISIKGPDQSPYKGFYFVLSFEFPQDYPFKPPKVRFLTKIYHCNINNDGGICLDVLKSQWTPSLTTLKLCQSIHNMLSDANADDPLDANKAQLMRDNRKEYENQAKQWAVKYAFENLQSLKNNFNLE